MYGERPAVKQGPWADAAAPVSPQPRLARKVRMRTMASWISLVLAA